MTPNEDEAALAPDEARLFRAVVSHALGRNHSDPMAASIVLRIARTWQARGDTVTIERADGYGEWTPGEFQKLIRILD